MAIVMVIIGFANAFKDMGISNAIIHRQSISHSQLSRLYWLNLVSGILLTCLVASLAPWIANFYGQPELRNMIILLSLSFFLVSIGNQYRILCQKELQFNRMAVIEIVSVVIAFIVAVTLAANGFGVYSLVFGLLSQTCTSSFMYLFIGLKIHHRPSFAYKHRELKGFFSFGLFQMGEKSINQLGGNLDKLLLGKMVGMDAVGFYDMAFRLVIFPLAKINPTVNKLAFPVFAKYQTDPDRLNQCYFLNVKVLSLVTIPLLVFLFFYSSEIVLLVFGDGWDKVSELLKILAVVGAMKALGNPGGPLMLAIGRADVGFWWNIVWTTALSVSLVTTIIVFPTVDAVAYCLLLFSITFGLIWHYIVRTIGKIHYLKLTLQIVKITAVAIVAAMCSILVLNVSNVNTPFLRVLIGLILCVTVYSPLLLFERKRFQQQYQGLN